MCFLFCLHAITKRAMVSRAPLVCTRHTQTNGRKEWTKERTIERTNKQTNEQINEERKGARERGWSGAKLLLQPSMDCFYTGATVGRREQTVCVRMIKWGIGAWRLLCCKCAGLSHSCNEAHQYCAHGQSDWRCFSKSFFNEKEINQTSSLSHFLFFLPSFLPSYPCGFVCLRAVRFRWYPALNKVSFPSLTGYLYTCPRISSINKKTNKQTVCLRAFLQTLFWIRTPPFFLYMSAKNIVKKK